MRSDKDLMHGTDWRGQDLAGWLLSEKLDGCRGSWDGETMWSRDGNPIRIPNAWRTALPAMPLDGEIWAGRERFTEARLAVQYGRFTPALQFVVFDAPVVGTLPERIAKARHALAGCRFARVIEHTRCASSRAAIALAKKVQWDDGEGLMANAPDQPYRPGRTRHLLKLKNF